MNRRKITITPKEYELSAHNSDGLKYNAITKRMRSNSPLPNVLNIKDFGRFKVLEVYEEPAQKK